MQYMVMHILLISFYNIYRRTDEIKVLYFFLLAHDIVHHTPKIDNMYQIDPTWFLTLTDFLIKILIIVETLVNHESDIFAL